MKLLRKEIQAYRNKLLAEQDFICPLCSNSIHPSDATLDHDHGTGHVRKVLHRSCNAAEGKILSWCRRTQSDNPLEFLCGLTDYWVQDYRGNPTHPAHLSDEQKLIKKYRKLRKRSVRMRTKQKYTDLITDLMRKEKNG